MSATSSRPRAQRGMGPCVRRDDSWRERTSRNDSWRERTSLPSSLRTAGTHSHCRPCCEECLPPRLDREHNAVWVPAFAGTTLGENEHPATTRGENEHPPRRPCGQQEPIATAVRVAKNVCHLVSTESTTRYGSLRSQGRLAERTNIPQRLVERTNIPPAVPADSRNP